MVGRRVTGQPCVWRAVWGAGLGGAAQAGRRIGEAGGISAGIRTIGPSPLPALTVDLRLYIPRMRTERKSTTAPGMDPVEMASPNGLRAVPESHVPMVA